ncbi:MAG: hypothetical protein P9M12_02765 [Candidatus Aceula lacicola]|nr:hypothetical protein [Candidatus Aceula lacicola]
MRTKLFILIIGSVALCLFFASDTFSQYQTSIPSFFDSWAKSISELKISMDKLSYDNDLVLSENKQLAQEIDYLSEQVEKENVKIENFGFEDGAVSQAIGEMREEIFRLERILSDFIKRKIDFEEKASILKADIKKKENQNERMGLEIAVLKKNIRFSEKRNKSGQKEYWETFDQYEGQKIRLVELLEMSEADRKDWNEEIENLNQEILSFRERFQTLNVENEKIYSEMLSLYEDALVLLSQQDSFKKEHAIVLEQYQKQSDVLQSEIDQVESQKQGLQDDFSAIEERSQSFKQHIDTEKVERLRSEAAKLEAENKKFQIELKKLKKDLSRAQKQKQQIERRIKNY